MLGIFSVNTPGYKNDLNRSFNQFTWVVTHPARGIKGFDLVGFDGTAVKIESKEKTLPLEGQFIVLKSSIPTVLLGILSHFNVQE